MSDVYDMVPAGESGHSGVDRWNSLINELAPQFKVPPNLCKSHMLYESGGDPNIVGSSGRGLGLMQIDAGTAKDADGLWYYSGPNGTTHAVFDPAVNIKIACRDFIAPNIRAFPADLAAVVAAYNAGIGAVETALVNGTDLTTVTFAPWYIPSVTGAYAWFCKMAHTS